MRMPGRHALRPTDQRRRRTPPWLWALCAVVLIGAVIAGIIGFTGPSSPGQIAGGRPTDVPATSTDAVNGSPYSPPSSPAASTPAGASAGPDATDPDPTGTPGAEQATAAPSTTGEHDDAGMSGPVVPSSVPPSSPGSAASTAPKLAAYPADTPAKAQGAKPCVQLRMTVSLENKDLVRAAATGYAAAPRSINGHCVTTTVTPDRTGAAAAAAAAGFPGMPAAQRPALWLPDSPGWLSTARAAGGSTVVPASGTPFASSAILLAMPQNMADVLGWQDKPPTWRQVFSTAADPQVWARAKHPEWGTFRFGKTSPLVATSGIYGMLAEYASAKGAAGQLGAANITDPTRIASVKKDELATSHYMATPEHFLWHAREAEEAGSVAEFLSAVVVQETSVWNYNRGLSSNDGIVVQRRTPPKQPLVPIYPADGVYLAHSIAVPLSGSWVSADQRAAAADFTRYLGSKQGQELVRANGFRDLGGVAGTAPSATGNYRATVKALPEPSPAVVTALQKGFGDVRKRVRVLFLVDVSGSMSNPIAAGDSRLQAAKAAVDTSLAYFAPDDEVGLAGFSNLNGQGISPGMVAPIAPLSWSRGAFTDALARLDTVSQTPLYQAVDQFSAEVAKGYQPNMINAVVVLSDGWNDTSSRTTAATMTAHLQALHHQKPVMVFTLAFGKDADVSTLRGIAKTTGAHYYDATDPTKISAVLGDLVTSF
jgi:Ca-activated chloride channel family protein